MSEGLRQHTFAPTPQFDPHCRWRGTDRPD
jgi:hypothetical protein